MGRTFENRKHAMAKRGDRDAKAFTRAGRQISMAVKAAGTDPDSNPALRRAIQNARSVNMPKDKVQNAIDKAAGLSDGADYEQILYEGYGPHGIAILIDTATDNPTRTVANIRHAFKKEGGNLGNTGSVSFMFDQFGVFRLSPNGVDRDTLELNLIDHGLEELVDGETEKGDPCLVLRCSRENFGNLQNALEEERLVVVSSGFQWVPKNVTTLPEAEVDAVFSLLDRLEQDDDVQAVFSNLNDRD